MKRFNEKGFSLVEGLLIVIALAMVSFVGYYVWHTQQDNDKQSVSNAKRAIIEDKPNDQASAASYLAVKELGIKIPVNDELTGLEYEVAPDGETVGISTKGFRDAVADCKPSDTVSSSYSSLGAVNKVAGKYEPNTTELDVYSSFIKQFPGFYLVGSTVDGGYCINGNDEEKNKAVSALFLKLMPELQKALEKSEQI